MSEVWWNLSGTDTQCDSYREGHQVHWIQHKHSIQEPDPIIPVRASVDDDGLVLIQGDLWLKCWNHRPALIQAALRRSRGFARWKPRWHLLVVPTGDLVDGASNAFNLATPDTRSACSIIRTTNPDHLIPSAPSPTNVAPLRLAARYAAGRPRWNGNQGGRVAQPVERLSGTT